MQAQRKNDIISASTMSSCSLKIVFLLMTVTITGINIISPLFLLAGYFSAQKT